jgi:rhamnose utilization protein RhaD (predicted bifunctional aldolase and dehydrogenase)
VWGRGWGREQGTLTPDHIIQTKRLPAIVRDLSATTREDVDRCAAAAAAAAAVVMLRAHRRSSL